MAAVLISIGLHSCFVEMFRFNVQPGRLALTLDCILET